jgi:hypothetical protein
MTTDSSHPFSRLIQRLGLRGPQGSQRQVSKTSWGLCVSILLRRWRTHVRIGYALSGSQNGEEASDPAHTSTYNRSEVPRSGTADSSSIG